MGSGGGLVSSSTTRTGQWTQETFLHQLWHWGQLLVPSGAQGLLSIPVPTAKLCVLVAPLSPSSVRPVRAGNRLSC